MNELENIAKIIKNSTILNNQKVIESVKSILKDYDAISSEEKKKLQQEVQNKLDEVSSYYEEKLNALQSDIKYENETLSEEITDKIRDIEASLEEALDKVTNQIDNIQINPVEVKEIHLTEQIKEVVEVDYKNIIDEVLKQLPAVNNEVTAEEVRDKLSSLEGDNRLDAKYIKNIPNQFWGGNLSTDSSGGGGGSTTTIVGITGTKAEYNTSLTDGNFLFVGDVTQYTDEMAQDAVGSILTDTTTVDLTYDDTANTIKADVKENTSNQKVVVSSGGSTVGTRKEINFIEGDNITLTIADNPVDDSVDVTINAAGGGGAGLTLTETEVDLGNTPRKSGKFNITSSGLTIGKAVLISQANGPYTGKGTRSDEAEMDGLVVSGKVTSTTNVECFWRSATKVKSNFKFNYQVSA